MYNAFQNFGEMLNEDRIVLNRRKNNRTSLIDLQKYTKDQAKVENNIKKERQQINPIQKTMQNIYGDTAIEERKLKTQIKKQKKQLKKLQQQKPAQKTNYQIENEMKRDNQIVLKNTPDNVVIREDQQYNDQQIESIKKLPFDQKHQQQIVFDTQFNCAYFIYHIQDYILLHKDSFVQITYQIARKEYAIKEDFYDKGEETVITTKTIIERLTNDLMKKLLDYQNLQTKNYDAMFCPIFSDNIGVGSMIYHAIRFQILSLNQVDKNTNELVMIDDKLIQRHITKGKYFNYYNLTNIDLSRYQIYKRDQKIDTTHCLLFSLKQSNQLSDDELLNIQIIMRKTGDFKLKDISNLHLSKAIQINSYNERTQTFKLQTINQNQKAEGIISICCFKNHYFLNEEIKDYNKMIYEICYQKYISDQKYVLSKIDYENYLSKWEQLTYFQKLQCYQYQSENLIQKNYLQNRINQQQNQTKFLIYFNKSKNLISLVDKNDKSKHDSKQLIQFLFNNEFFEEILEYNKYNQSEVDKTEIKQLNEIPKACQKKFKYHQKQHQEYLDIICADFEAFTRDEEGKPLQKHKNFMLCYQSELNNTKQTTTNINYMMNQLMNQYYEIVNENLQKVNQINKQILNQFKNLDGMTKSLGPNGPQKKLGQKEYRKQKQLIRQQTPQIELNNTFLIKFYNLSYDAQFIIQSSQQMDNILNMNGRIISFSVNQSITNDQGKQIPFVFKFVDNLMLFNQKLSALPKMLLNADQQKQIFKEIFPYNYYTQKRYQNNIGSIDDAFKDISNQYENSNITKQDFINSITKANALINNDSFNMFKYAEYYCQQDVTVQKNCNLAFQKMVQDEFNLNINDFISISSLSFQFQKDNGVFENVYQTSGILRKYLKQFQVGGRTMTGSNKKWKIQNSKIQDFDARSLYPSAQNRMYYPAGEANVLAKEQIDYYNIPENLFKITEDNQSKDQSTLFLTVRLFKDNNFVNKMIPVLSQKNEGTPEALGANAPQGTRLFKNDLDLQKNFYLTHVALQDAIKFQHYKYQIISGIYYSDRNYTINNVIKNMYEKRLHYKSIKNPIECIYKLTLNSSYGKLIEGLHGSDYEIINDAFDDDDEITDIGMKALFDNLDGFQNAIKINNKLYIETSKAVNDAYNFNQCGVFVLDYSKRIINEVLDVIENLKVPVYYADTDSQQFPIGEYDENVKQYKNLYLIEQEFKNIYHRELIGKNLGQFHVDFDSKLGDVDYADNCIYVGKKVYFCNLIIKQKDQILQDQHIRCKGINGECILKKKTDLNISTFQLYDKLYNGEEMTFDQADVKACFKKGLSENDKFLYTSLDSFQRNIKFTYDEGIVGKEFEFK